jgi:hypothetical protein
MTEELVQRILHTGFIIIGGGTVVVFVILGIIRVSRRFSKNWKKGGV